MLNNELADRAPKISASNNAPRDRGAFSHRRFRADRHAVVFSSVNGSRVTGSPACSPSSVEAEPRSTLNGQQSVESTTSPTSPVFNAA